MKFIFSALAALAATTAFASPAAPKMYNLDLKVERKGQLVAEPRLSVIEGETATITQTNEKGGSFVEVTAKEAGPGQVRVEFLVGDIDAKGKRTTVATPQIIALENETASLTSTETAKGKRAAADVSVSVTARSEM